MTLTPAIQAWIESHLNHSIDRITPLKGGITTSLYRIEAGQSVVLRLYDNAEWLRDEPDLPVHEASSLQKVADIAVPTPRLIAYEKDASACGIPVLLMTALDGKIDIVPQDPDSWLRQMAQVMFHIHQVPVGDFSWRFARYADNNMTVPRWATRTKLWHRLIAMIAEPEPTFTPTFIHRDFHPMNLLWQDGRISGVVDWINACVGSAGSDLAHCRLNLALMAGVESADAFLNHYEDLLGTTIYHPYWDLVAIADFTADDDSETFGVYPPWLDFGLKHLTSDLITERIEDYIAMIFARLMD